MTNQRWWIGAAAFGLLIGSTGRAQAGFIPIVNPSFESPNYNTLDFGPATGWVSSTRAGAFNPIIGTNVNAVPDGMQVGFAGLSAGPASMTQDLGILASAGMTYQLNLFVGSRKEGIAAHFEVELLDGSTTIGMVSGIVAVGTGDFFAVQVNATGRGLGDLGIRLSETGNGGQSLFDNLVLQSSSAVPEPSSLAMCVIAGVTSLLVSWRRLKWAA